VGSGFLHPNRPKPTLLETAPSSPANKKSPPGPDPESKFEPEQSSDVQA
jgi:hypothetical protein